ncbi:GspE/PulE family protein [Candidatus Hydrogenedentota bacterium]
MSPQTRRRLGEILVEDNLILPEQLEAALARQKQSGRRLGQVLLDMHLIAYDALASALSEQSGVPHIWLRRGLVDPKIINVLTREKAESSCVMPMFKIHNTLTLAMVDTEAIFLIDDIENLTGCKIQCVQCRREDIELAVKEYYGGSIEMEDFLESFQETDVQVVESQFEDLHMVEEMAEGARIINLLNMVTLNSINAGASDIHIEPDLNITRVRYRIDGALQEVMTPRADLHPAIISRVKVMANMDIAERRLPQDGRIHVRAEGREVDLRVSTMPTVLGEKVVMRLLDKGKLVLDINKIGFHQDTLVEMKRLLHRPNGIILVTGPTGSGKTTCLYCGLTLISSIEKNIVTIEDPVEFQLEVVNQIQVNEEQGLTFAKILRSILRQDPDVVMVGEIRDRETAEVAIQAALTGHLVLSTLHTNESAGAIARLIEMGIEPYLLTSGVIGVVAQRLVRLVCSSCQTPFFPPHEVLERIGWKGSNTSFVTGRGCERCFDSGLKGRAGIFELLVMDDKLRQNILVNPSIDSIRSFCARSGMRTLKDEAFRLVEEGKTTLEEVMRIVFVEDVADEVVVETGG